MSDKTRQARGAVPPEQRDSGGRLPRITISVHPKAAATVDHLVNLGYFGADRADVLKYALFHFFEHCVQSGYISAYPATKSATELLEECGAFAPWGETPLDIEPR